MPSVSAIARRAGVSKSTVSLVLNNKPNVTDAMRRRVLQAVEDLQRAAVTVPVETRTTTNVLLIHPISLGSQQVFREMLQGVKNGIEEANGRLTLAVHQPPLQPEHATHTLLHDRAFRPDGVIVMGARIDDPIFDEIRSENLPCVLLGRQDAPPDISAVGLDNEGGTRQAMEYLIRLGHRRIAFLGGNPNYDYTHWRQAGYGAALQAAKLETDGLIFLGSGDESARNFLNAHTNATAILFVNDEHALRALPILRHAGLRIPNDLSVVSFDDTDNVARYDPPLTAVSVPRIQIGYWTAKALLDCVRQSELKSVRLVLRTRLTVRASCQTPQTKSS